MRDPLTRADDTFTVRHGRRRWPKYLLAGLGVLVLVSALTAVWVRHQVNPGSPGAPVAVSIPANSSTSAISSILAKAGVIHSPSVFRFYLKADGAGALLPGDYQLPRNSSYDSVIAALTKGPPIVYQHFTIPEGFTVAQIAARVGALPGRSPAKFLAAVNGGEVHSQFQPAGQASLEGLLFPATYQVRADETEVAIVRKMVATFEENANTVGVTQAASQLGMTPYQVITVASMVEREAKLDEDRGPIASVIYNRLHKNMLLQVDATLLYGLGTTDGKHLDTGSDNPYNTYKLKGLPPTPISSPGIPSLRAASSPPTTTFLYYVLSDANGKHGFATTAQEFAKLEAAAKAKGLI